MRISANILLLGALGATAVGIISCATVQRTIIAPPHIPGAQYVGQDQCALCHEAQVKDFHLTQHSRVELREAAAKDEVAGLGCEACHGPGSLHVDSGGKRELIVKSSATCFECHRDKQVTFGLQSRHPVKEGRMDCTACHDPHGKPAAPAGPTANALCAQCHREQARPHVFEHEALREGCVACHNVHGSINPKLLTERDNNLCLKCHAQVAAAPGAKIIGKFDHTSFLKQGTCFSAGCHPAVHGSDVNSHLRY